MTPDVRSRLANMSEEERKALLVRLMKSRQTTKRSDIPVQPRNGQTFPLAYAQQRIWLLQRLLPADATTFNIWHAFRLSGPLDRSALQRTLDDLVRRHETLRTTFELAGGEPVQRIAPAAPVPLLCEDLYGGDADAATMEVERRARDFVSRPWDVATGPLVRAALWRVGEDCHAFVLALHHIVCDWWSMAVLQKELFGAYEAHVAGRAPVRPDVEVQCADFAVWQRQWLQGVGLEKQLAFWRRSMQGAPTLRLPTNSSNRSKAALKGLSQQVLLGVDLTRRLRAFAQAERVTPFITLLAAFSVLLSRCSGQREVVIGSPLANRHRRELEHVIGCFMNPLPFRLDLTGDPTFRELLRRARETALEVYANQDVPFDIVARSVQARRESPYPLFQALFLLHAQLASAEPQAPGLAPRAHAVGGLEVAPWPQLARSTPASGDAAEDLNFPVALELGDGVDAIAGKLQYAPEYADVFADAPSQLFAIVERAVSNPDRRISDLLETPASTTRHSGVSATTDGSSADAIDDAIDVFEAFAVQAEKTPDAAAVVAGTERVTFGELSARVARLAARLQAGLVTPDTPVAVLLDRSVDALAAILAILRAGGAYLPIDPALPAERMRFMLQHVDARVVLTRGDLLRLGTLDATILEGRSIVCVDEEPVAAATPVPPARVTPDHLAYVLYTSGSSGRPKAVAIPRGALANYVAVARRRFGVHADDRVLQFASLSFDTAAEEIFPALTCGAGLVLRTDAMLGSVPAFLAACAAHGVTVLDLPTAYWHELTAQIARGGLRIPDSVRLVILGGERALAPRLREWRAAVGSRVRLLNTYGPTETTVVATMWDLTAGDEDAGEVPIGRPIANVDAWIADRRFEPAPRGTVAELCIGGAGLARGYLNDPALTAERFVPHPASAEPGARLYCTGDLARMRDDGVLEFAGRRDGQVKLRGYRIEPGEVEAVFLQHPDILEAIVLVRQNRAGDARLIAYAAPFEGRQPGASALRAFLLEKLPDYMVPSAFTFLDRLPRTVQQKVDRDALPPVDWSAVLDEFYQPPQTELEVKIAALWAEVLHRDRVGLHDNFFDLGGHSLLVIQLHARMTEEFGEELSVVDLFQFPTVSSQAERLAQPAAPSAALAAAQDRGARQRQAFQRMGK